MGAAVAAVFGDIREWSLLGPKGPRQGPTWLTGTQPGATSGSTAIAIPPTIGPGVEATDGAETVTVSPGVSRAAGRSAAAGTPTPAKPVTSVPATSSVASPEPLTSLIGRQVVVSDAGSPGLRVARSPSSSKLIWQSDPSDAVWVPRRGLSDAACVSFESAQLPGQYIRYWTLTLWVMPYEATQDFQQMATFCPHANSDGSYTFEALRYPGKFLARSPDGTMIISSDAAARRFYVRRL